jgi:sugar phosphate isomerase/epimerase
MKNLLALITLSAVIQLGGCNSTPGESSYGLFSKENLVAWCIVPFDACERNPEQRATMLNELGISRLAYDYRDEHIPSFRHEIGVLERHRIDLSAVWLWVDPSGEDVLNEACSAVMEVLKETGTRTELWVSLPGHVFEGIPDAEKLDRAVNILSPVLQRAEEIGCTLALYNHGGWFGEPENQVRIIETMASDKVGIVYNFHHGHHQVERFNELLEVMMPYLTCININGMMVEGPKIITLGEGDRELGMLRAIAASGYRGPIGIIGHTEGEDIRVVLERNLKGLWKLTSQL